MFFDCMSKWINLVIIFLYAKKLYTYLFVEDLYKSREEPVLEVLHLPTSLINTATNNGRDSPHTTLPCLLCQEQLDISETLDEYLKHILETHKLVIADVNLIASFKR